MHGLVRAAHELFIYCLFYHHFVLPGPSRTFGFTESRAAVC